MQKYSDFINEQKLFNPEFSNGQEIIIDEGLFFDWIKKMWKKFTNWLSGKKDEDGKYRLSHWPNYRDWDDSLSSKSSKSNKSDKDTDNETNGNVKLTNAFSFNEFYKNYTSYTNKDKIHYPKFEKIIEYSIKQNTEKKDRSFLSNRNIKKISNDDFKFDERDINVHELMYSPPEDSSISGAVGIFMYVNKIFTDENDNKFIYIIDCEISSDFNISKNDDDNESTDDTDKKTKIANDLLKYSIEGKTIKIIDNDIKFLMIPHISEEISFNKLTYNDRKFTSGTELSELIFPNMPQYFRVMEL